MRVAVFVDAGYVYTQCSLLIPGSDTKKSREGTVIRAKEIVDQLTKFSATVSKDRELLRIYWYDGEPAKGLSQDHKQMRMLDNVKLRLGQINSDGQQKGVDSLIVTDLIELARNKSISDAVVFTGDEDIRIALQIAQGHGARVHLLGIGRTRAEANQSLTLQNEADTVAVWDKPEIEAFLKTSETVKPRKVAAKAIATAPAKIAQTDDSTRGNQITKAVNKIFNDLAKNSDEFSEAKETSTGKTRLPGKFADRLNAELKSNLKGGPTKEEFKAAKEELRTKLRKSR